MQSETIPLKDPPMAALFAWLVPGLGHLYQGRVGKAILFAVCIWTTFLYGMYLGDGGVVFFRWDAGEQRWAYICQVGMGLPALPALCNPGGCRTTGIRSCAGIKSRHSTMSS